MYQDENENEKPLIMPENCPPLVYPLVNGYAVPDIKCIAIVTFVALVVAIIQYIQSGNIFISVAIVILCSAVAIILRGRDQYSENFMDRIRISNEYRKSKKHFIYMKHNEFEEVEEDE